jgi:hypothetical protein
MTKSEVLPNMMVSSNNSDQIVDVTQTQGVTDDEGSGEETKYKVLSKIDMSDARPDPKPRKYPILWQSYLWWFEMMETRKRHLLRISSIDRGKSNLDSGFEKDMMSRIIGIDNLVKFTKTIMVDKGKEVPVWDWVTSIKGLGEGGLAAQLLSQIDDIQKCPTVASLWRYAGYAVIKGKAEKNQKGEKSKFNRKLKGICFNIADSFIKQQTPVYVDIYYSEKKRQRELNPDILCKQCGCKWEDCQSKKSHIKIFTDAHIHNRAWRKMVKTFLRDLWIKWRKLDQIAHVTHQFDV